MTIIIVGSGQSEACIIHNKDSQENKASVDLNGDFKPDLVIDQKELVRLTYIAGSPEKNILGTSAGDIFIKVTNLLEKGRIRLSSNNRRMSHFLIFGQTGGQVRIGELSGNKVVQEPKDALISFQDVCETGTKIDSTKCTDSSGKHEIEYMLNPQNESDAGVYKQSSDKLFADAQTSFDRTRVLIEGVRKTIKEGEFDDLDCRKDTRYFEGTATTGPLYCAEFKNEPHSHEKVCFSSDTKEYALLKKCADDN